MRCRPGKANLAVARGVCPRSLPRGEDFLAIRPRGPLPAGYGNLAQEVDDRHVTDRHPTVKGTA